jgi:hypothetical protein
MKRILHLVSLLAAVLSFTSPSAHGQTGTCSPTNVGPSGPGTLVAGQAQSISFTISWTGFPQRQNIAMDVFCEIKNTTTNSTSTLMKLTTVFSNGNVSGTTGGTTNVNPLLITPAGSTGNQGSVQVIVTCNAPGTPGGGIFATPAPTYK